MFEAINILKRITYFGALLLGVVWLMPPGIAVAEKWPIKKFAIVEKNMAVDFAIGEVTIPIPPALQKEQDLLTATQEQAITNWLEEVANHFEGKGFRRPRYEEIQNPFQGKFSGITGDISTEKKFIVYAYKFGDEDDPTALAYSDCKRPRDNTFIAMDPVRSFVNGKLTTKAYQDLAHELFHMVQYAYPMFQKSPCNQMPGAWISEGTAEAVGIETARRLKGLQPDNVCLMGIRSYSDRLYIRKPKSPRDLQCGSPLSYQTQSFWQFLGEYATRKGFVATEAFATPDFRYLDQIFEIELPGVSQQEEYAWLDKGLRQGKPSLGISLHRVYSRFVGTFASYWKDKRRNRYAGGSGGDLVEKERRWIEEVILGTCVEVKIAKDPDVSIAPVNLSIGPVAAECIKVNYDFKGRVGLTFYATGENESIDLESLAISTNGGKKIIRRHPAEPVEDKIGKFSNISAKTGTPQYFIVSNVQRKNSGNTSAINPIITIVPEIATTNMAKEKKAQGLKDPTEKEERKTAGKSRSWKGKVWQNKGRPCKRPFEAAACGPRTDIGLLLVPDTAHLAETLAQPSMSGERKFRLFDEVAQKGSESFVTEMMDDFNAIHEQDGGVVDITIPQIQPGFTGTISNAHINVSKASGDKGGYRAIGPWVGSCKDGYRPSTGTVTIEEFSKYILRGTFSAQLVDTEGLKACQSGSVAKPDSGSFSITEIDWNLGFETPELDDDAIIDDVVDDTNAIIPGLMSDDLREAVKEHARKRRQEKERAKQKKAEGTAWYPKQCDCSCEKEPTYCEANPQSKCCQYCDPIFKMCKNVLSGHQSSNQSTDSPAAQAKEAQEIQGMRQRYEAYVDTIAPYPAVKQMMMDQFDSAKTIDEKRILMMGIHQ